MKLTKLVDFLMAMQGLLRIAVSFVRADLHKVVILLPGKILFSTKNFRKIFLELETLL